MGKGTKVVVHRDGNQRQGSQNIELGEEEGLFRKAGIDVVKG